MKDIEQLATQFRKAIDMALEAGELIAISYIADSHVLAAEIRVICWLSIFWIRESKQIMSVEHIGAKQMGTDSPMHG